MILNTAVRSLPSGLCSWLATPTCYGKPEKWRTFDVVCIHRGLCYVLLQPINTNVAETVFKNDTWLGGGGGVGGGNNRSIWNHLKIIQKISEKHTWKARCQETTHKTALLGTSHMLRKVLTLKSAAYIRRSNITCTIYWNHGIAAKLYTVETWFVSGT